MQRRTGDYYTQLQGDGNLVPRSGMPDNPGTSVFSIQYSGEEGDYFLGIDCNLEFISVYQERATNPGRAV